jgi:hypothetical protein
MKGVTAMTATRAVLIAAAVFGGFASAPAIAGQATNAPWCAVHSMGRGDAYWDCRYASIQACQPAVLSGNRGFCNPNPRWVPVAHRGRHKT